MKRFMQVLLVCALFLTGLVGAALATHTSITEFHPWSTTISNTFRGQTVVQGTVTDEDPIPHPETVTETVTVGTTTAPPPPPPPPPGGVEHSLGFSAHTNVNSQAAANEHIGRLAAIGARYIRDDFAWAWIEQGKGFFDWSRVDIVCSAARLHNVQLIPGMGYSPAWANGGRNDKVAPLNVSDFYDWAYALANHLKADDCPVLALLPWNEPNIGGFFTNPHNNVDGDVDYYVRLHDAAYDAIKLVYPSLQVWGPDIAGIGARAWDEPVMSWMEDFIRGTRKLDAIAVHPYYWGQGGPNGDDGLTAEQMTDISWPNGFARVFHDREAGGGFDLETLENQLDRLGLWDIPIHATEVGVPTDRPDGSPAYRGTSEQEQARWLDLAYTKWKAAHFQAGVFLLYTDKDADTWDTLDPENHFGAFRDDWAEKPIVSVYRGLAGR